MALNRKGPWERKIWEDIAGLIDTGSGGLKVEVVKDEAVDGSTEVSLDTIYKLKTIQLLTSVSDKLDKTNFLLEQISGIDVDLEDHDGLD